MRAQCVRASARAGALCVYVRTCVCVCVSMHARPCAFVYVLVRACMHACARVCMRVRVTLAHLHVCAFAGVQV